MKTVFKKALAVCLCFVLSLPLLSCRTKEGPAEWDEEKYEEENAYMYRWPGYEAVCYDGMLYYIHRNGYLYYAAADGSEAGPLCSKPECTHNSSDCGAHVNTVLNSWLMMYNGRLYWLEGGAGSWTLVSAEPGSGERRIEQKYEGDFWYYKPSEFTSLIDGKFYFCGRMNDVVEGKPEVSFVLYEQELESGSIEKLVDKNLGTFEGNCIIKQHKGKLYIALTSEELTILTFDLKERVLNELYKLKAPEKWYSSMAVEDDRIVFGGGLAILTVDMATGKMEELYHGDTSFMYNDKAVLEIPDMTHFECYDYNHELIGEWCFEDMGLDFPESDKTQLGCIDGKLYFMVEPMSGDVLFYLFSCVPEENRFEIVQEVRRG